MLWALTSAKGSPGVTTTALALAAVMNGQPGGNASDGRPAREDTMAMAADGALLVELDPAGGDLECWCGPHGEPGVLRAVTALGHQAGGERLSRHAVEVVRGVDAVLAPTTEGSMTAALRSASDSFADAIAAAPGITIVDLGRWASPTPLHMTGLVHHAAVAVVVCRSALASVEHARALVATLQSVTRRVAVVMVGGDRPYSSDEVSAVLNTPVAGVLPWDPRGVAELVERGITKAWARSTLANAATGLAAALAQVGDTRHQRRAHA
jgi:MinD-like ATPase involved in chromosome partitioning or flagellar assembly